MCSNYKLQVFKFELCSFFLLGTRLSITDLVFGILFSDNCVFYTCKMFKKQSSFNQIRFKTNILSTGFTAFISIVLCMKSLLCFV